MFSNKANEWRGRFAIKDPLAGNVVDILDFFGDTALVTSRGFLFRP